MRNLDLDAVEAFVLTAELQSFTRAAKALNATQAGISTQLKRLERRLGQRLLDRTPRRVRLSSAGAAFLAPAREMLAAQRRALAAFDCPPHRFALGISHHLSGGGLPDVLRRAMQAEDRLTLELRVGTTAELLARYADGSLDAVVLLQPAGIRHAGELLARERFGWFAVPDLAFSPGVPLPLAIQAPPCSLRALATERLDAAGVAWREVFTGGGGETIGAAVAAGVTVAALPVRAAPPGAVESAARFGLPPLPTRDAVLHARPAQPHLTASLRLLRRAFSAGAAGPKG